MASLPMDFEEPPVEFSKEAIRLSEGFQREPSLQHDSCHYKVLPDVCECVLVGWTLLNKLSWASISCWIALANC